MLKFWEAKGIKLIASGGISTFDELPKLAELGCEGTIIGKAIYEGRISLKQLEQLLGNSCVKTNWSAYIQNNKKHADEKNHSLLRHKTVEP
jgi:tRNA-dihydrouridine synthase